MSSLIGQRLGQYEIIALLGKGGMAAVYLAKQTSMKRDVAIKTIKPDLAETPDFLARFEREAQTVAQLSHPYILKVFDYGQQDDLVYLVMELLRGGNLAEMVTRGSLSPATTMRILDQIASALDYAHERGIIHRDLKPQNVMLDEHGNAHLTDFGIAKILSETTKLTQSGAAVGTPTYMAPEQWEGLALDARADVYALGVMVYEMLAGSVPFSADTPFSMMHKHIHEAPPSVRQFRPDLPAKIEPVLSKALAKNRVERYPSAGAFADALRGVLGGPTTTAVKGRAGTTATTATIIDTSPSNRTQTPTASRLPQRGIVIGGAIAAIILIGLLLFLGGRASTGTLPATATGAAVAIITQAASETPAKATVATIAAIAPTNTTMPSATSSPVPPSATVAPTVVAIVPTSTLAPSATSSPIPPSATAIPASSTPQPSAAPTIGMQEVTQTIRSFGGQIGKIYSVAVSPDGKLILTGGEDKIVRLWDLQSGKLIRSLRGHTDAVPSVSFSPDGMLILTGSGDATARLWDVQSGKLIRTFSGHTNVVQSAVFSTDGKYVLTGSYDNSARLWDAQSGKLIRSFEGHGDAIWSVAFSPDSKQVLTGSADQTARIWDLSTGKLLQTLSGHTSTVYSVGYTPDGKYVLTGSDDKTVRVWDAQSGKSLRTLTGHSGAVNVIRISPDGKYVLTGSDDSTAQLSDIQTGQTLRIFTGHSDIVDAVAFAPDAKTILTGSWDQTARLWETGLAP